MTPSKPVQKNDGTTVGRYFEYNTEGAWMGDRTPIFVIMKDLLTPIEPIEED